MAERLRLQGDEETRALGRRLAARLSGGERLALVGPLGAGKTTLVKGLAEGLGMDADRVLSPTFVLHRVYHGDSGRVRTLHHVDAYRMGGFGEYRDLGLEELLDRDAALVVEWADRLPAFLHGADLRVHLEHEPPGGRRVTLDGELAKGFDVS